MTKAKMPVAKHHTSRMINVRARLVWTEELTFLKAGAECVDPFGCDPCGYSCAPIGRRSRGAP